MKKEDIFDGITDIRDDLVVRAERKKRSRSPLWRGAVAAVLVVAIAAGGFAALRFRWRTGGGTAAGDADKTGAVAPGAAADPNVSGGMPSDNPAPEDALQGPVNSESPEDFPATPGSGGAGLEPLAAVVYPERPPYPVTEDGWDYDEDAYNAWASDSWDRRLTKEELETLSPYNRAMMPALLGSSGEGNTVSSPANLYMALAMLAEVTEGESRAQVLELLGCEDIDELRALAGRLWEALYNDDGTYTLSLANSLWLRDDMGYVRETVDRLAADYYAETYRGTMGSADMDDALQSWLNGHTGNLLTDQVGGITLPEDTALALASTLLFRDRWEVRFDPEKTETGLFHAPNGDLERDFMKMTLEAWTCWADSFTGIRLPFEAGGTMVLLLPDEGVSREDILADPAALAFLRGEEPEGVSGREVMVHLALPKFDVSAEAELTGMLAELGVTDVFDPGRADFSPLTGDPDLPVWVSQVLHGARLKADEEGCEGAAYTLIVDVGAAAPPNDKADLTFDRPFLFSVVTGGVPVFTGVIDNP